MSDDTLKRIKELDDVIDVEENFDETEEVCPDCGSTFVVINGHCHTCFECGWSLCAI